MRPKIGLLFVTSGWFRQVGLQSSESALSDEVDQMASKIASKIRQFADVEYDGILFSEDQADIFGQSLSTEEVDGLILAPLMWCEDQILVAALQHLQNLPILLCTFIPDENLPKFITFKDMLKGSGSVGTLQMSGYLKKMGYQHRSVSGYYKDEQIYDEIEVHCRSFLARKKLSTANCGILPYPCDQMMVTHVNDKILKQKYGINISYLSLEKLKTLAQSCTNIEISEFKHFISDVRIEVPDEDLNEAIKYALAMEKIINRKNLDVLAINDVCDEVHQSFGLRPCLENPRLTERGTVICMEAEVAAGIAMFLLQALTGEKAFYTELLNTDLKNNNFLMGHAGYHPTVNADPEIPVRIVPDIEYKNVGEYGGACTYFKFKPDAITAVNCIFDGERLRMTVFEGESQPGPEVLEAISHLICKIDFPILDFYNTVLDLGVSQHWVVVPGHHAKDVGVMCNWLDIGFEEVI